MSGRLRIVLRAGERMFLNGAAIKVDRKVSIELMSDAVFLLEQHVIKPEEATTPLRQLYFVVQMMLMDPAMSAKARAMAADALDDQLRRIPDGQIHIGLGEIAGLLAANRPLEALKKIRTLYPAEALLLQAGGDVEGRVA